MCNIKKFVSAVCAVLICVGVSACSNKNSNSSAQSNPDSVSSSTPASDSADSVSAPDESSVAETSHIGEYLQQTAQILSGDYTMECTLSGTDIDGEVEITRVVRGDDVYQLQQESLGSNGMLLLDGVCYNFDNVCGIYSTADTTPEINIIEQVVELNLDQTETHIQDSSEDYAVEEYTYTGDTYITVLDFYFEKESGSLAKYTVTYSVEGQDDVTETREINRLDSSIDETVFNTDFTESLADFDGMSEDQRLGFCQGICGSYGISTDDMNEMGITTDNFKTIAYDRFFRLVYTYGDSNR